jgi:isopentenyl-diphosphate Delta-isomerase
MLWPLFWDSSCASHPLEKEDYVASGERRLKQELGFSCSLFFLDKFYYKSKYKKIGIEHEICAILIGTYSGKVKINSEEVMEIKWLNLEKLKEEIKQKPFQFTPWLKKGFKIYEQTRNKINSK